MADYRSHSDRKTKLTIEYHILPKKLKVLVCGSVEDELSLRFYFIIINLSK